MNPSLQIVHKSDYESLKTQSCFPQFEPDLERNLCTCFPFSIISQRHIIHIPELKVSPILPQWKSFLKSSFFECKLKDIIRQENQRLNNYKRDKGNGCRNLCKFLCYKGGGRGILLFLGCINLNIASCAPSDIAVNTSPSAPRPLYSRHTMHTKTISRDGGILDDFLIEFIPHSCHQSNDNKSIWSPLCDVIWTSLGKLFLCSADELETRTLAFPFLRNWSGARQIKQ